ncbi:MAG: hypothetical protein ACRCR2_02320 [Fusobacteriaceae bacterium]
MPNPNELGNLVQNIRQNLSADNFSAQSSVQENSSTQDPITQALKQLESQEQARQNAWFSDTSNPIGAVGNVVASMAYSGARVAGDTISSLYGLGVQDLNYVSEEAKEAYIRVTNAQQSGNSYEGMDKDKELLNQRIKPVSKNISSEANALLSEKTQGEAIANALSNAETQKEIRDFFNIRSIVNQENQNFVTEAAKIGDAKFADKVESGISKMEKGNVLDGITDIAAGAVDAILDTGKNLSKDPITAIKATSELAGELVGDVAVGSMGMLGKLVLGGSNVGYAAGEYTDALLKFKEDNGRLPTQEELNKAKIQAASLALAETAGDLIALKGITGKKKGDSSITRLARGIAGANTNALAEGVTETYQTVVENSLFKDKTEYKGAFTAGVMGALAGGGTRVGSDVASSIGSGAEKVATKASEIKTKQESKTTPVTEEQIAKAVDTSASDYNVAASVETLARATHDKTVTPEKRQEYYSAAQEQVNAQSTKVADLEQKLINATKENFDEVAKEYEAASTELGKARQVLAKAIPATPKEIKQNIGAAIQGDSGAARRSFGSFQAKPSTLTADEAIAIADADNQLTEVENQQLRSYAAVEKSLQSAEGVRDNIINGGIDPDSKKQMLGINNYRDMILSTDSATANAGLKGLGEFATRHNDKAADVIAAFNQVKEAGGSIKVPVGFGKELTIHKGSGKLVGQIMQEATLLNSTYAEFSKITQAQPTTETKQEQKQQEPAKKDEQAQEQVTEPTVQKEVKQEVAPQVETKPTVEEKVTEEKVETKTEPEVTIKPTPGQVDGYSLAQELTTSERAEAGNRVAQQFVGSNKTKALNTVNDFATRLKANVESFIKPYVKEKDLAKATVVGQSFSQWNDKVSNAIDAVWQYDPRAFRDEVQFLANEEGKLPDNVKTALAVGAYNWIISNGKDSTFHTPDSIRNLLGLADDAAVPPQLYEVVPTGARRQSVINAMGVATFQALNLKMKKDAPSDAQAKLETALGIWVYEALVKANVIEQKPRVSGKDILSSLQGNLPKWASELDPKITFEMAQLNLTDDMNQMIKTNSTYSAFTNDVFGSVNERPMPSYTAPKAVRKISKSSQQVPKSQQKVLEKDQAKPYSFRANTVNSFFGLPKDMQRRMMGYQEDTSHVLKVNEAAVAGKNRSIDRELEIAEQFFNETSEQDTGLDTPFFFQHTVWKQGRMGLGNLFNPQSSKIHRYLVTRDAWKNEISLDDQAAVDFFMLSVGEGFDIETAKVGSQKALEKTKEVLANPVVQEAINQLKEQIQGNEITDYDVIEKAVKIGEGKMKSYLSLVSMAEYQLAQESGLGKFTHSMSRETDGITNGVCISTLQFANASMQAMFNVLNRMGIYQEDISFNEWSSRPENQDSYKSLARDWQKGIEYAVSSSPKLSRTYIEVSKLFGSFTKLNEGGETEVTGDGRKIAKSPLMTSIYGAGISGIIEGIGNQAVDKIYSNVEKAYAKYLKDGNTAVLRESIKNQMDIVHNLTGQRPQITLNTIRDFKLQPRQVKAIQAAVKEVYEAPLKDAMDVDYKAIFDTRNQMNGAVNLAHEMFVKMYNAEKAKLLTASGTKVLTVEQEQELFDNMKQFMPIVNTATSKLAGRENSFNTLMDSGLILTKTDKVPDMTSTVEVKGNFKGKKSSKSHSMKNDFAAPGVGAVPMMVQSVDAATQLFMMAYSTILNVHDASYISWNEYQNRSLYNRGFETINKNYSVPSEIADMFNRVADAFEQSGLELDEQVMKDASKAIFDSKDFVGSLEQIKFRVTDTAAYHTQSKLNVLSNANHIEQYSNGEDSGYVKSKTLGSSRSYQEVLDNNEFNRLEKITSQTSEQLFDTLQQVSEVKDTPQHLEHLREVLTGVINQVLEPMNIYMAQATDTPNIGVTSGMDMHLVNQINSKQATNPMLTHGVRMSSSEVYVHELVHNVTQNSIDTNPVLRKQLERLWKQAKQQLTVRDFMEDKSLPESSAEYQAAKERYDYIFNPKKDATVQGKNRSNYLHEFVAHGLTNKQFIEGLSKLEYQNDVTRVESDYLTGRLIGEISAWFQRALNFLNHRLMSLYGKTVDKQLAQLFTALAGVDSSIKGELVRKSNRVMEIFAGPVVDVLNNSNLQKVVEPVVKFKGIAKEAIRKEIEAGKVSTIGQVAKYGYNKIYQSNQQLAELFLSLVTEARGRHDAVKVLHDLKRLGNKNIDRFRKQMSNDYAAFVNEAFKEKITPEQKQALSRVFLKTDIASLLDNFTQQELEEMLKDPSKLEESITNLERELASFEDVGSHYIKQARNLGQFMVTGKSYLPNAMLNAQNIADLLGTDLSIPDYADHAATLIDQLASLHALKATKPEHRTQINKLVSQESVRTDNQNGITTMLNLLKEFKAQSDKEFADNPRHMVKGYMTDKVNPNIDVRVVDKDRIPELEAQGYTLVSGVQKDMTDPTYEAKYMMVNRHGANTSHIGGVAYIMNNKSRGTSAVMNAGQSDGYTLDPAALGKMKAEATRLSLIGLSTTELSQENFAIPVVDGEGNITNYRYVMSDDVKDEIMDRDMSFDDMMGIMFSNLAVKDKIKEQNQSLVTALYDSYAEATDLDDYVEVSPTAQDSRYRENWSLLPEDMKQQAKETFGSNVIFVRKSEVDLVFGYHKYSAANLWKMSKEDRNAIQNMVVWAVEAIFGKKAALAVRRGEELMKAIGNFIKDAIVIKSGVVTLGNIMSNVVLLSTLGVPMKDILKGHKDSYQGMKEYKDLHAKVEQVRLKLSTAKMSQNQRSNLESELARLEERLAVNPVAAMMDHGLLSTIVEDIDTDKEEYKLKQRIKRKAGDTMDKAEALAQKIPEGIRMAAKEAFVMHGSQLYDFLNESAQFSDFGARYVLFKHMVEKKGMEPDVVAGEVMDIFIDYDLPTHKGIQYLNDLGVLMFSKYVIRVQKMILKILKEHPARVASWAMLQNFFGDISDITDSAAFIQTNPLNRFINPFAKLTEVPDDILTMRAFN